AGPTNNWMAPAEAKAKAGGYLKGAMKGRTMYVIPYLMGPAGSDMSRVGVMVTDSQYVVASMHLMTRVGSVAIQAMRRDDDFIAGLHSLGDLSPERRLILHFPEEKLIWSVGSGFFGVAPNTSPKTNPNGTAMVRSNTIFTNVALTPSKEPWWEGLTPDVPSGLIDWQGRPWQPASGPAAHPNSRFTVDASQCPSISPNWEDPQGVPISAL